MKIIGLEDGKVHVHTMRNGEANSAETFEPAAFCEALISGELDLAGEVAFSSSIDFPEDYGVTERARDVVFGAVKGVA